MTSVVSPELRHHFDTEPFLAALVASADDAIMAVTLEGIVEVWNPAAERLCGRPASEMIGAHWAAITTAARAPELVEVLARIRRGEPVGTVTTTLAGPANTPIPVTLTISAITNADATITGASTIARDRRPELAAIAALLDDSHHHATTQAAAPIALATLDDHYRYLTANPATATMTGTPLAAHPGRPAAEITPKLWAQLQPLWQAALHHHTTTINAEITGETPAHPGHPHTWLHTCYPIGRPDTTTAIATITIDITARKAAETALDALTHAVVDTIAATVEAKDPYSAGHERRVADISAAIATQLGLDEWATEGIKLAANIRDIGKINVPTEILFRPGQLRPLEYQLIQGHSQAGHDIIATINFPWPIAQMVLQHHERYDGSGYPDGLTTTNITLGARIIAVADVIDSMASQRPYRAAQPLQTALTEIQQGRGTLYDPTIVDACLQLFHNGTLAPGPDGAITVTTT